MLETILAILTAIAGTTAETSTITAIVNALVALVPVLVKEYRAMVPIVKNIIAALSANPASTAEQLATLQALDAQVDSDFESAAAEAQAEDGTAP